MARKRLLVLGGKPIGSCELVNYAHEQGDSVIVADYLPACESFAKGIADESWDVSTADVDELVKRARAAGVNGVLTGVHEFNLDRMAEVADALGLPCYATKGQLDLFTDKDAFKNACRRFGVPVAKEYSVDGKAGRIEPDAFPVAVKPEDGSGSRGFSRCENQNELVAAIEKAKQFSSSGKVLVEEFVDADAVIIQYTAHDGEIIFSGMTDKYSRKMGGKGAPIMALQIAPSLFQDEYLATIDEKARAMLTSFGITEGPIWIEAFHTSHGFVFNEAGFRFGGSLTYYLVKALSGIDQMKLLYDYSMGNQTGSPTITWNTDSFYVIWPVHLRPGHIAAIQGLDAFLEHDEAVTAVSVHGVGDVIEEWGSAQQVLLYLHLQSCSLQRIIELMNEFLASVHVISDGGAEMLFALFDPREPVDRGPSFLTGQLQKSERR